MTETQTEGRLAAEIFLETLASNGVDYLFVNPGTDFPPIVEAYGRMSKGNAKIPRPVVVPHENAAISMAHGYTMVTGRAQAVLVHVNVGTANGLCALINASRERIPMIYGAGRTPITENGPLGTRNGRIHWAQEMYDQAGMLRELVKWDYELRRPDQVEDMMERAFEVAMASPSGPVYVSLPREVIGATVEADGDVKRGARARSDAPAPQPGSIALIAEKIAGARCPLILTASCGRRAADSVLLADLADRFAIPVVSAYSSYFVMPASHPMYQGPQPSPLLAEADVIVVLETDVPWIPSRESPREDAFIAHIGEDPVFQAIPMRSFRGDVLVQSTAGAALSALSDALAGLDVDRREAAAERRSRFAEASAARRARAQRKLEEDSRAEQITHAYLNGCLAPHMGPDTLVVSEYSFLPEYCPIETPGTFYGSSSAGGLGWGLGAALGAKLADPDKLVIAVLGDGAYVYDNPAACHWVSEGQGLPVLVIIHNNQVYGAVRRATLSMYGKGAAAEENGLFLAEASAPPRFEKLMDAHGGYGERVERPEDLPAAIQRGIDAVRSGRQALINVICAM